MIGISSFKKDMHEQNSWKSGRMASWNNKGGEIVGFFEEHIIGHN